MNIDFVCKGTDMNFDQFVNDIEKNAWNVFGTEVYLNGVLKYSYGDTRGLHEIYSATKTVLSIAVGVLFDEGCIDLDRPVTDYLPRDRVVETKQYDRFHRIYPKNMSKWQHLVNR